MNYDNIYAHKDYSKIRWLCYKVKNEQNIDKAAYILSKIIPQCSTLIPMPGHTGNATWTLKLCKEIVKLNNNLHIFDCLYELPNEGTFELKKKNIKSKPKIILKFDCITCGSNCVLIDNVYDTGNTYRAACKAIGKEIPIVVLGKTCKN